MGTIEENIASADKNLNALIQKDINQAKYRPREAALLAATKIAIIDASGNITAMTNTEILSVADELYQWLIKDLNELK